MKNFFNLKHFLIFWALFIFAFSLIACENTANKSGEESIIYDVNSAQFSNMVVVVVGVIVFICLVVAVVIWQFIKLKRDA